MKRSQFFAIVLTFVLLFSSTVVFAEGTYYDNITHKLGRGVSNVLFSWVEVCRSVDNKIDDLGLWSGLCVGPLHGSGRVIGRIFTGAFDIVTFLAPTPTFDTYYMEPEFVMIADPEDSL
ncbi:exosortase system-associated protein, TIGR04073 family [Candidatus Omnitrophota bacterium]